MRSLIWLLAFFLTACGGGGGSSDSSPSTASIQTYFRDPTIAYDVAVTNTTKTQVTVPLMASGSSDFTQLNVNITGYQPTWYPMTAQESTSNVQLGLYRTADINRKSNFIKGVIPHDAGGWLSDAYRAGYFPSTWDRIKYTVNGNMVVYADSAFVHQFDVTTNAVTMTGDMFPDDSMIIDMGSMARTRGMDFMVMVGIYPGNEVINRFFQQVWTIPATNQLFWDAWFSAYKNILINRARVAVRAGATHMAIGFNLSYMMDKGNYRWADLISAVRTAGFTGKISYFDGTNYETNEYMNLDYRTRNEFIQLFDQIGLATTSVLIPSYPGEVANTTENINRMKDFFTYHINSISSANVPIVLMISTPSTHGGIISSEYVEPNQACSATPTNYQQQADVYEAVAEVINDPVIGAKIGGLLSWGYAYRNNMRTFFNTNDSCYEKSASIRGKPAEAVLSYWFKNW